MCCSPVWLRCLSLLVAGLLARAQAVAAPAPPAVKPGLPHRSVSAGLKSPRAVRPPKVTTVELFHVNRKETMVLRLRDERGRSVRGLQKRFDRFLRCHYTNVQRPMSPRLMKLIYQAGRHWPGRRVEVVSGYRHPNVAKNPRSPHMQGLACDFRVVGVSNTELRDYLRRAFDKVGVGYYPELVVRSPGRPQGSLRLLDRLFGAGRTRPVLAKPQRRLEVGARRSVPPDDDRRLLGQRRTARSRRCRAATPG